MENLPQELVDHISSYLELPDLKNTLLLSRKFQSAAEEYSGAFKEYKLTQHNASKFLSIYSGRRRRYPRQVSYETSFAPLGPYSEPEDECRDTADEMRALDEDFTRQINFLFSTMEALESQSKIAHQTDSKYTEGLRSIELIIYAPTRAIDDNKWCIHRYFVSWRIHLLTPSMLPELFSVRTLTLHNGGYKWSQDGLERSTFKLDLRILLDLSSRLPNLVTLHCKLGGDDWLGSFQDEGLNYITHDWEGPRRDSRHDFAKGLTSIALPSVRHAQLDFLFPLRLVEDFDQRRALPGLTKPTMYDPFSNCLRLFSYQLRTLNLRLVADETLFWPVDGSDEPSWPYLKSIKIMFHMSTPSGSWYFNGLPGVGATHGYEITRDMYPPHSWSDKDGYNDHSILGPNWDDEWVRSQFRVEPNNETIVPFLIAFARAAAMMPALKEFALWTPLTMSVPEDEEAYEDFDTKKVSNFADYEMGWGIAYTAPGEKAFSTYQGEKYSRNRQIWWKVGGWRPPTDLHERFRHIGSHRSEEEMVEYWGDEESGEGLCQRNWFQDWEGERWEIDTWP